MKNELEAIIASIGAYKLAQMVGVKHPTIHSWRKAGRVPAGRVLVVEKATGVSRSRLRPDLYPVEDQDHAA